MERDLKEFKVYNTKKLQYVRSIAGHRGNITSAEHIWDRDILATCANDLSIILWDLSTWQKKGRIMTNDIQLVLK
jgi:WD40 repeat protein